MVDKKSSGEKAPWITHRPELKVLDCTVRDGGLINDHLFEDELVRDDKVLKQVEKIFEKYV